MIDRETADVLSAVIEAIDASNHGMPSASAVEKAKAALARATYQQPVTDDTLQQNGA